MNSFLYEHYGDSDSSWDIPSESYYHDSLSFDCQAFAFTYPRIKRYTDKGVQTELSLTQPGGFICSPFRGIMSTEEVVREINLYIKNHQ